MTSSELERLEKEIQELREAYRFLALTVQYQDNPRLPFIKYCSQNFIYGDKYSDVYGYLMSMHREGRLSDQDLSDVYSHLRDLGVQRGSESECLTAFRRQVEQ